MTFLGDGLGKDLGHAIELRLDALNALGDTNWIVEDGCFEVMRIGFLSRLELIKQKDVINKTLFICSRFAGGMRALGRSGCHGE